MHSLRSGSGRTRALVAALALAWLGPRVAVAAPANNAVTVVTPVDSGTPWTADDVAAVETKIDALLGSAATLRGAHVGFLAVTSDGAAIVYGHAPADTFAPGSTYKIVTTATALRVLGPQFRFHTTLLSAAPPAGGRIDGAVVLRGGGDPTLSVADLDAAAAAVAASGVHEIRGGVTIDQSAFAPMPYAAGWTWDDFVYAYAAPITALSVNRNAVRVTIVPGNGPGSPAQVSTDPALAGVPLEVAASTGDAKSVETIALDEESLHAVRIVGNIPAGGAPVHLHAAIPDPSRFAAAILAQRLAAHGVTVREAASPAVPSGPPPANVLWSRDSAPLGQLLPPFLLPSDNFYGEVLVRMFGAARTGGQGSIDRGLAAMVEEIGRAHVDPATVTLADGCGVSQYDRLTPSAIVALLDEAWASGNRALWLDALPIWGVRGTLSDWPTAARVQGRVFAKTGSLMHQRGLAGYVETLRHGPVTFAFLLDDWMGNDDGPYQSLMADVLGALVDG